MSDNIDQSDEKETTMTSKDEIMVEKTGLSAAATGNGAQPYLYLTPIPPPCQSQAMLSNGQSMRQAPHSMQFS